ncbi:zinc-binding dehydrogenase [Bradyrhizobium cenepequi]
MAAAAIAKSHGAEVISATRSAARFGLLRSAGADHVLVDDGIIAETVKVTLDGGIQKVLELVGTTTLADSLQCTRRQGSVCMTGMVGDSGRSKNSA